MQHKMLQKMCADGWCVIVGCREKERLNKSSSDIRGGGGSARDKRVSASSLPSRPLGLDISASQPNVSMMTSHAGVPSVVSAASGPHTVDMSPTNAPPAPLDESNMSVSMSQAHDDSRHHKRNVSDDWSMTSSLSSSSRGDDSVMTSSTKDASPPVARKRHAAVVELETYDNVDVDTHVASHNSTDAPNTDAAAAAETNDVAAEDNLLSSVIDMSKREVERGGGGGGSERLSQATLLTRDSGFSQLSRETTPATDASHVTSGSQELLDDHGDDIGNDDDDDAVDIDQPIPAASDEALVKTGPEPGSPDWHHDIDNALAEIMHDVQSLEKQQHQQQVTSSANATSKPAASTRHTPDLVIGLPVGQKSPSPAASPKSKVVDDTVLSTAEVFANNSNQSTLKKVGSKGQPIEASSSADNVPRVFGAPSAAEAQLMGRTASVTASRHKQLQQQRQAPPPRQERRRSDPATSDQLSAESLIGQQSPMFQPRAVHSVKAPQPRSVSTTPERPGVTPEKPPASAHDQHVTPRSSGPKPPLKVKPPVLKKTFKSPDVWKKVKEAREQHQAPADAAVTSQTQET